MFRALHRRVGKNDGSMVRCQVKSALSPDPSIESMKKKFVSALYRVAESWQYMVSVSRRSDPKQENYYPKIRAVISFYRPLDRMHWRRCEDGRL